MVLRRLCGGALALIGICVCAGGVALMAVLGPDGRVTTGPHDLDSDTAAVVTAPGVVDWSGIRLDVVVEVPISRPIFVGVGNTVDVQNYLHDTARLQVTGHDSPWPLRTERIDGEPSVPSAPTALDWWMTSQAGLGGASISVILPDDEQVSVAIVSIGEADLSGLRVTLGYGVKGGFVLGAGIGAVGAGLAWLGLLVWRRRPTADAEEVVEEIFIYIDEDGTEHRIDPADLDDYEIVEESQEQIR